MQDAMMPPAPHCLAAHIQDAVMSPAPHYLAEQEKQWDYTGSCAQGLPTVRATEWLARHAVADMDASTV